MKIGEIVRMKSANIQFGSEKVRGSMSMKAVAGKEMAFIYIGGYDPKAPEDFHPQEILRQMGWIPGPDLQAEIDADTAAAIGAQS